MSRMKGVILKRPIIKQQMLKFFSRRYEKRAVFSCLGVSEGREAARAVDIYLMGTSNLEAKDEGILAVH
ncbi:MAG: hypothetical protein IPO64_09660 [Bacteroidetes bacterium]|nr:hypothetical protein [Bacteroidota bacterium]